MPTFGVVKKRVKILEPSKNVDDEENVHEKQPDEADQQENEEETVEKEEIDLTFENPEIEKTNSDVLTSDKDQDIVQQYGGQDLDDNDLQQFESLLFATDSHGNNILHLAALKRSIKLLNLLFYLFIENDRMNLKSLIRRKNLNGESFFQMACNHGCLELAELLLKNRAQLINNYNPINDHDNNLNTPLLSSILHNQHNVARLLIEYGADLKCVNLKKQASVHLSCMIGSYEITEHLIRKGATLNCIDINKMNPLSYACKNGNVELVKMLLDTYESVNIIYYFRYIITYQFARMNQFQF